MKSIEITTAATQIYDQHNAMATVIVLMDNETDKGADISVGCVVPLGFQYGEQLAAALEAVAEHIRTQMQRPTGQAFRNETRQ